ASIDVPCAHSERAEFLPARVRRKPVEREPADAQLRDVEPVSIFQSVTPESELTQPRLRRRARSRKIEACLPGVLLLDYRENVCQQFDGRTKISGSQLPPGLHPEVHDCLADGSVPQMPRFRHSTTSRMSVTGELGAAPFSFIRSGIPKSSVTHRHKR